MKILLTTLNSQYVHSNPALKYLYTVTADSPVDVSLREFTINNEPAYVYGEIMRAECDLVCFSCYIWNIEQIKALAADLKKAAPTLKIALGGPEVSFAAHVLAAQNSWIDYIFCGEGEYSFYRFCQLAAEAESKAGGQMPVLIEGLNTVPGLVYRQEGRIYVNPQIEPMDLALIPFPYSVLECEPDKVIYYESSRGCPFRCSYCLSAAEKSVRALPLERVRSELGYFLYKMVRQVKFIDRTFNYDEERAYEIFRYLIDNDNGVSNFHFEICADLLTPRLLALLATARKGLFQLEIGIQSANPKTLAAVGRRENIYPILYNVEKLLAAGNIHIHVDLIAGLPYESYELFARSFDKVYALGADMLQLGFLKLLGGSPLYEQAREFKIKAQERAPYEVISTAWLSARELVRLKEIEKMLSIYYNRGGFARTLAFLLAGPGASPFKLYEKLADFYYGHGFQHRERKKEDQYRILRAFCAETLPEAEREKAFAALAADLEETFAAEEVRRFLKRGWEIA